MVRLICPSCKSDKLKDDFMVENGEKIEIKVCVECKWWG